MRIHDIKKGEYILHRYHRETRIGKVSRVEGGQAFYSEEVGTNEKPGHSYFITQTDIDNGTVIISSTELSQKTHPEHFL